MYQKHARGYAPSILHSTLYVLAASWPMPVNLPREFNFAILMLSLYAGMRERALKETMSHGFCSHSQSYIRVSLLSLARPHQ